MAIYYNSNTINDWNFGDDNIAKVYYNGNMCYQKIEGGSTPPTPTFNGKWKATYADTSVVTADCDASSAITQNEIALSNLVEVEIGDCVTSIGQYAFQNCTSLESINIPDNVTTIHPGAFKGCGSLTSITIPDSVIVDGNRLPDGNSNDLSATFDGCGSLENVYIGSGVTIIGYAAFQYCYSLKDVTVNSTVPPTLNNYAFRYDSLEKIYVPAESVSDYQSASGWSSYASIIQAIP